MQAEEEHELLTTAKGSPLMEGRYRALGDDFDFDDELDAEDDMDGFELGIEARGSVSSTIHGLLKILKSPLPPSSDEELDLQGWFFKQRRWNPTEWNKKYFVFRCNSAGQLCFYYYKNQQEANKSLRGGSEGGGPKQLLASLRNNDDPHALNMLEITHVAKGDFTTHEKEQISINFTKQQETFSEHYLKVFTPTRIFTLTASSDEELDRWYDPISRLLHVVEGDEEYARRDTAAKKLEPLLRRKYYESLAKAREMVRALEVTGFFEDSLKLDKDKQGTMEMLDSHGGWTRYRFVLKGQYLYYYLPHQSTIVDRRVILLKFCTLEVNNRAEEDGSFILEIVTPVVTYVLKARHKVAAEEWADAIERNKAHMGKKTGLKIGSGSGSSRKGKEGGAPLLSLAEDESSLNSQSQELESVDGGKNKKAKHPVNPLKNDVIIEYYPPNRKPTQKPKTFKIKKTMATVGRSTACDLAIDDSRISREHARFDIVDDHLVFIDLGSKRGSKLNHHMVKERKVLCAGDVIKVGRTYMTVTEHEK